MSSRHLALGAHPTLGSVGKKGHGIAGQKVFGAVWVSGWRSLRSRRVKLLPGEESGVTPVSPLLTEGMSFAPPWLGHLESPGGGFKEGELNPLGFAFLRDCPSHQQRKNFQAWIPACIRFRVLASAILCCDSTLNSDFPTKFL